jgi:Flp pilus assembly protein TadG
MEPAFPKGMTIMNMMRPVRSALTNIATRLSQSALARFARNQRGATAVEFSMVMVPFLAILFAIMETALVFFATQSLETVAADSARLILTGQAQNGALDQAKFKDEVCKRVKGLFNCANKLFVDVRKFQNFASIAVPTPVDANGNLPQNQTDYTYQPGGPGDIVVVRLLYNWPIYVTFWNQGLTDMPGSNHLLVATAAFRNEPY